MPSIETQRKTHTHTQLGVDSEQFAPQAGWELGHTAHHTTVPETPTKMKGYS